MSARNAIIAKSLRNTPYKRLKLRGVNCKNLLKNFKFFRLKVLQLKLSE